MWRFLQISKNALQLKLKLHQLWRIAMLPSHDCMNFKLELVFLRIMWVFGHFFTCQPTWSQLETFNLIGVNVIIKKKAQRSTGTVKSIAPCQTFFSRLRHSWLRPSANTENSRRTREKPLVPRVHECRPLHLDKVSVSREGYTPVFGHDVMESNPSSAIVIYTAKRAKRG